MASDFRLKEAALPQTHSRGRADVHADVAADQACAGTNWLAGA